MVRVMAGNRRGWEGINMMTKQAFLDRKPAVKRIEIPEWDDCVYIKKMSAGERVQLVRNTTKVSGKDISLNEENFMDSIVRTCQTVLCDSDGVRLFDDSDDDFGILNDKDGAVLSMIFSDIMAFNGMGLTEEKDALKN